MYSISIYFCVFILERNNFLVAMRKYCADLRAYVTAQTWMNRVYMVSLAGNKAHYFPSVPVPGVACPPRTIQYKIMALPDHIIAPLI